GGAPRRRPVKVVLREREQRRCDQPVEGQERRLARNRANEPGGQTRQPGAKRRPQGRQHPSGHQPRSDQVSDGQNVPISLSRRLAVAASATPSLPCCSSGFESCAIIAVNLLVIL